MAISEAQKHPPYTHEALARKSQAKDLIFSSCGIAILVLAFLVLAILIGRFLIDGWDRLGWDFLTGRGSARAKNAGIGIEIVTSCLVMLVTALIAVPLGVASGVYLEAYAKNNRLNRLVEINITNLAGVPSIVYGLLALGAIQVFGLRSGIYIGGLALALLILPVMIVATRESIRAVPRALHEAAYGIGADKWQTIRNFILPSASSGIITGAIIGLSRAIGETAPLITVGAVLFNVRFPPSPITSTFPFVDFSWLGAPITVLPLRIYDWTTRPQEAFLVNASAAGFVLIAVTFVMNGFSFYIRYRLRRKMT